MFLPFLLLLALVTSLGVSLWLAALNVQFRDVRYTIPFLTQFWMFATPIAYPSSLLSEPWRTLYGSESRWWASSRAFGGRCSASIRRPDRWSLRHRSSPSLLLVSGAFYFRRMERTFADVV